MQKRKKQRLSADEEAFIKALGERIRELRKKTKLNQDDFADEANLHRSHIGLVENGKYDPRVSTLLRIAKASDVELWELIKGVPRE